MTSKERITRILARKPVDRIGLFEHLWGDTHKKWTSEGKLRSDENIADHFGFDLEIFWPFNGVAKLDYVPEVIEENDRTIVARDGNGAVFRRHKLHDTTPEHIDFLVKDRAGWEEHIKPFLKPERRRINFTDYRATRDHAAKKGNFFAWSGVNVFEQIHPVCGHMAMLEGMIEDPEWVKDMSETYADWTIAMMEMLFAEEGKPDGIWFYEDMGFKERPFMSPAMYREFIFPAHKKTIDYVKFLGLPVIMHSCGFIEPLLPGMVEAGIDCLQVIEVKAGMDLLRIYRNFGDRLSLMGGIDVRVLYTNDKAVIDAELLKKIPAVKGHFGYVLHSDHSIPNTVNYDSYRYFVDRGLELGAY